MNDRIEAMFLSSRFTSGVQRRGITILEVLIAAGVLAIGMFGVMALIPLISMRLREGDIADRSAVSGRNAVESFQTRGWTNANRWRWYRADGVYVNPLAPPAAPTPPVTNNVATAAVCVDPLGVVGMTTNTARATFPVNNLSGEYAMQRVTINDVLNPANPNDPSVALLNQSLAEAAVVSEDDMLIERPEARTDLPKQSYTAPMSDPPPAVPEQVQTRRMFQRDYSSLATLTPLYTATGFDGRGNYLLSTAIFYQRGRDYDADEHIGFIESDQFHSAGVTGGEATIVCTTDAGMLGIAKGDWVMLTFPRLPIGGANQRPSFHAWYQVIEAAPYAPGDTDRAVTLSGADWPYVGLFDVNGNSDPGGAAIPIQVTWLPGVVTVYERTVTLSPSGIWN